MLILNAVVCLCAWNNTGEKKNVDDHLFSEKYYFISVQQSPLVQEQENWKIAISFILFGLEIWNYQW